MAKDKLTSLPCTQETRDKFKKQKRDHEQVVDKDVTMSDFMGVVADREVK